VRAVAVAAAGVISTGCCLPLGDGAFFLDGEAPSDRQCKVTLESSTGEHLQEFDARGRFSSVYTVSPCGGTYNVTASCGGVPMRRIVVKYGDGVRGGEPVHLGNIAP